MAAGFIEGIIEGIRSLLGYLEFFLGGLFGLYLVLVILRWRESARLVKILKQINANIELMADHLGVQRPEKKSKIRIIRERMKNGKLKKPQRRKHP